MNKTELKLRELQHEETETCRKIERLVLNKVSKASLWAKIIVFMLCVNLVHTHFLTDDKEMERTGLLAKSDGRTILFPVGETDTKESQVGRQGSQPDRHPSKPSSTHQVNTKENYENQAEVIYAEYPRNVGKPDAILKIISALKKTKDFGKLLSRTKQYAQVTVNKEKKFIPHPATWFNQERYNDSPDEWSVSHRETKRSFLKAAAYCNAGDIEAMNVALDEMAKTKGFQIEKWRQRNLRYAVLNLSEVFVDSFTSRFRLVETPGAVEAIERIVEAQKSDSKG